MRSKSAFEGLDWTPGAAGVPLIAGALAIYECDSQARHDAGDHAIVLGRVIRVHRREGQPLVFHGGAYGTFAGLGPGRGPGAAGPDIGRLTATDRSGDPGRRWGGRGGGAAMAVLLGLLWPLERLNATLLAVGRWIAIAAARRDGLPDPRPGVLSLRPRQRPGLDRGGRALLHAVDDRADGAARLPARAGSSRSTCSSVRCPALLSRLLALALLLVVAAGAGLCPRKGHQQPCLLAVGAGRLAVAAAAARLDRRRADPVQEPVGLRVAGARPRASDPGEYRADPAPARRGSSAARSRLAPIGDDASWCARNDRRAPSSHVPANTPGGGRQRRPGGGAPRPRRERGR